MIDWKKYPNFMPSEFRCKCGCNTEGIKEELLDLLQRIRTDVNFPLPINSGYRCPEYNDKVSATGISGPHTTGLAVDIGRMGEQGFYVLASAIKFGVSRIGIAKTFIHIDISDKHPSPRLWSY